MRPDAGFGIYIHWPFCEAKCPYCDFNSHVVSHIDQSTWCNAYLTEIDRYAQEFPDRIVRSIFFGGGTPSLMDPKTVEAIVDRICSSWRLENNIEITLEANPSSVELERFTAYRQAGVNRVSLGVQALNETDLRKLGRLHSAKEAHVAMDVAQTVFDRSSFDLIYARQDQDIESWQAELKTALRFGFSHMSLYQLTIEDGTAFGDRYKRGRLSGLPDDDVSADMYDMTIEICDSFGLEMYEVSNFARPGQESLHNLIYWNYGEYVGIGPGAHGRLNLANGFKVATETRLAPSIWLTDVKNGRGESVREALSLEDQLSEYLVMGLRLRSGVNQDRLLQLGWNDDHQARLESMTSDGIFRTTHRQIIVEKQYVKLLDTVLGQLVRD